MGYFSNVFFHITDFCNENCSFCFARKEMKEARKKIMDFKIFCELLKKFKKEGSVIFNYFGGEPTLHPEFPKIVKYTLKHFFLIRIFTNGIFSSKVRDALLSAVPRVYLVVNISTPGFQFKKEIRKIVLENIFMLASKTPITLSIVNTFIDTSAISLFDLIDEKLLREVNIKLSLSTPVAKDRNFMHIGQFPSIGENVCEIIEYLEKRGPPRMIRFNKSYRPCMFAAKQKAFLKKRGLEVLTQITRCHDDEDWFQVNSDLLTFKCYPLSTMDTIQLDIDKDFNLKEINQKYNEIYERYHRELILPQCRQCPYFGFEKSKCSGPCIGFRINALKEKAPTNTSISCSSS